MPKPEFPNGNIGAGIGEKLPSGKIGLPARYDVIQLSEDIVHVVHIAIGDLGSPAPDGLDILCGHHIC